MAYKCLVRAMIYYNWKGGSTVVEILPHHAKVSSSSQVTVAGIGGKKMVKKPLLPNVEFILTSWSVDCT